MSKIKTYIKTFVLFFIAFCIISNVLIVHRFFFKTNLLPGSSDFPGTSFLPLRPYLQGIRLAGYWSDLSSSDLDVNVKFMYLFQHVQVILAPTLLDHYDPLKHEYVLVYVEKSDLNHVAQTIQADLVVKVGAHIGLLRQKRWS